MTGGGDYRERPILFSGPMVRAILAGTKTQTRRVIGPKAQSMQLAKPHHVAIALALGHCRYGVPGDRLWVKETFADENLGPDEYPRIVYAADREAKWRDNNGNFSDSFYLESDYSPRRWKPSIFMPRWVSRITLEVTCVRAQRLQDIDDFDALAEGVSGWVTDPRCETPREGFRVLWDSINGKRSGCSWEANPWVWAVSFAAAARKQARGR